MSRHKPNRMIVPKLKVTLPTTFTTDPVYRRHDIPYVTIIGKLPPLKVVVKKIKCKPKKRGRPRREQPSDRSAASMAYVRVVREAFREQPEVFHEFAQIMGQINRPSANLLELINRIVALFNGHPDLIYNFDAFLPKGYEMELQDDAVVVRVFEEDDPDPDQDQLQDPCVFPMGTDPDSDKRPGTANRRKAYIDESMAFIREVKRTFPLDQTAYREFMDLLWAFQSKSRSELDTIKQVVRLFRGHPHLVLGFNDFLSPRFSIRMYDTKKYSIQIKNEDGDFGTITVSA